MAESIIKDVLSDKLDASKLKSGYVLFDVTSGSHTYSVSDAVGGTFPTGTLNNYVATVTGFYTANDATANVSVSGSSFLIQSNTTQKMRITYIGVV